ncbi:MAG: DUF429 domain-containing protein [Halorientalis sp.]
MLHGVDFSGAAQAGHGIRIAEAAADGGELRIESCESAADRFGVAERAPCLGRLTEFLRDAETVGLDFPFGVPAAVHGRDTWTGSLEWVATVATDADAFQSECRSRAREATDGERADLRRETDGPVGALCPYGSHVWKQTFFGIRDVLAPLARTDAVAVRPMQDAGDVSLCEVYPAATLASCDLPAAEYKDGGQPARERRRTIVEGLEAETPLAFAQGVRAELIDDAGGDALDAVVAALATYRAREADFEPDRPWDPTEGHIYV